MNLYYFKVNEVLTKKFMISKSPHFFNALVTLTFIFQALLSIKILRVELESTVYLFSVDGKVKVKKKLLYQIIAERQIRYHSPENIVFYIHFYE